MNKMNKSNRLIIFTKTRWYTVSHILKRNILVRPMRSACSYSSTSKINSSTLAAPTRKHSGCQLPKGYSKLESLPTPHCAAITHQECDEVASSSVQEWFSLMWVAMSCVYSRKYERGPYHSFLLYRPQRSVPFSQTSFHFLKYPWLYRQPVLSPDATDSHQY